MAVTPGAMCSVHATARAVDVCARCGRFTCEACADVGLDGETSFCVDCRGRLTEGAPSPRATRAVVFGVLALACLVTFIGIPNVPILAKSYWVRILGLSLLGACPVLAIISVVLGLREARAVRANAAALSSLRRVRWAYGLSACALALMLLFVAFVSVVKH